MTVLFNGYKNQSVLASKGKIFPLSLPVMNDSTILAFLVGITAHLTSHLKKKDYFYKKGIPKGVPYNSTLPFFWLCSRSWTRDPHAPPAVKHRVLTSGYQGSLANIFRNSLDHFHILRLVSKVKIVCPLCSPIMEFKTEF